MANSLMQIVSDGSLSTVPLTIKFFEQSHINVYIDDVALPTAGYSYAWSGDTTITITPAVALGVEVSIRRRTPADYVLHDFQAGAVFSETSIDENFRQDLFLLQEASEQSFITDLYDNLNMHANKLVNLGEATSPNDAVSLGQVATLVADSGGSPYVRRTITELYSRSYAEAGYNLVAGSFEAGGTLVNASDVLMQERTGKAFSGPAGAVAADTDPTSGGFVDRSITSENAVYANTSNLALRKFPAGKTVIITDRVHAEFLITSGGTPDGYGILDAGNGNTAVIQIKPVMSIRMFGAELNSTSVQNGAIQKAITVCAGWADLIVDGDGQYLVSGDVNALTSAAGLRMIWGGKAQLKIKPTAAGNYKGFHIISDSVTLEQPYIIGERDEHLGSTAENGHCIEISGGSNVVINNPRLTKPWGDGMYISIASKAITINDPLIYNARRNGISVIDVDGLTINGGLAQLTQGTNPQAGIDLEPNNPTQKLKGVRINNFRTLGGVVGISVATLSMDSTSEPVDVVINAPSSDSDNRAIQVSSYSDVKGQITINDPFSTKSEGNGILLDQPNINGPRIVINDPVIFDNNFDASTSNFAGAAIAIFAPSTSALTHVMGNVQINRPRITNNGTAKNTSGIYIQDSRPTKYGYDKIDIVDPVEIITKDNLRALVFVAPTAVMQPTKIRVSDANRVLYRAGTATNDITPTDIITHYSSRSYTANANVRLAAELPIGTRIRFDKDETAFTLRIVPLGCQVMPIQTTAGGNVDSTVNGSSIVLEKYSATIWRVVSQTGTWVAS